VRLGLAALMLCGCAKTGPVTPANARSVYCSDASVIALDESCKAAIYAAKPAQRAAVVDACSTMIDLQALTCGDP
jgi:hypothetical protein